MPTRPRTEGGAAGRVVVFGAGRAEYAARTLRWLRVAGLDPIDLSRTSPADLAPALASGHAPVWLLRAGAWPVARPAAMPPPSGTGRPLCAVGRSVAAPGETASPGVLAWDALLAATGGDLARAPRGPLPSFASVYLEPLAIEWLAARVAAGATIQDGIAQLARSREHRVVRVAALDVYESSARLRVAQIVTTLQRGGAERVAIDLTRALRARGTPTVLLSLGRARRPSFSRIPGVVDLSGTRTDRGARARAIACAASDFGADLLHAHLLDAPQLRLLASSGFPRVVTVHNSRPGWPLGLETLGAGDASLLVACCKAVEDDLARAGIPIETRTIWNAIEPVRPSRDARKTWRARLGLAHDDLVLLAVANPRPQKRLHLLPAILRATRARLAHDVRLVVAGAPAEGDEASVVADGELRAQVAALGVGPHVVFAGSVDDVAGLYEAADVLVSPSAWEGLSLVQLEAVAARRPVVASSVGGAPEIARAAASVHLVAPGASPEDFAEAIAGCASAPVEAGLPRDFTLPRMAERHAALYASVLSVAERRARRGVFLVINNFSTGGAQSSARRLLVGLANEGVRVRAAVLQEHAARRTAGSKALEVAGVPVLAAGSEESSDPARAVEAILDAIRCDPPEALLFWNAIWEHKMLLADAVLGVPIYDVSPGEMYFSALDRTLARGRLGVPCRSGRDYGRRLAGVVVKYRGEAERAARELGAPVHVVPNGVPLGEQPSRCATGRFAIGTAARISPQKKLEELLRATRHAHDRLPPYALAIAGAVERGADVYARELRVMATGLPARWAGEPPDMRGFLSELDVFAMIAEPAGCPNASLEAMAAGLPVIATAVGGAPEQVEDGVTGRLVAPGDAEALGDALVEASRDPDRLAAWGAAGRRRAEALFDVRRMVRDYRGLCGV